MIYNIVNTVDRPNQYYSKLVCTKKYIYLFIMPIITNKSTLWRDAHDYVWKQIYFPRSALYYKFVCLEELLFMFTLLVF